MRIQIFAAAAFLLLPVVFVLLSGCEQTGQAQVDSPFAPGAFPPTLSDTEDHRNSWTRADCLTCHETGENESPVMKHASLPEVAKQAKCRTCHVFVEGSQPRQ